MVSKQFTALSLLMPIAMSLGTLFTIFIYKNYEQSLAIVVIVSITLFLLIFFVYSRSRRQF